MILLLNGAFGIGKTSVARALVARMPRTVLFDPEPIGIALQRIFRVDDFQDLRLWRRLTIFGIRVTRLFVPNVIVPMAFSNLAYLDEIRDALMRFDQEIRHVCLIAPVEVVHERLRNRGRDAGAWELRRAEECCVVHQRAEFAMHVDARGSIDDIARAITSDRPCRSSDGAA